MRPSERSLGHYYQALTELRPYYKNGLDIFGRLNHSESHPGMSGSTYHQSSEALDRLL